MSLPRLIDVDELFADPVFSSPTISPDGTRIAYLAEAHGRRNVWVRGLDQEHADAVCVTHDARRGVPGFFWTKDPRFLLYLQDTDGNEDYHVFRVDLDAPEAPSVDLTPMDAGSRVLGAVELKEEPGVFLVQMNKRPTNFDVFRLDVASGEVTLYLENPEIAGGYLVGRHGELYFQKMDQTDGAWEYYAVDGTTAEKTLLHRFHGPDYPVGIWPSAVAADGRGLLLGVFHGYSDDLALVRLDGTTGEQTVLAAVPGRSLEDMSAAPAATVITSAATGAVVAARFVGPRQTLQILDPAFGELYEKLATLSDGVLARLSSDDAEQLWVATFSHDREPDLSYLYDSRTGESRLLFRPYPTFVREEMAPMLPVSLTARDGMTLEGFLTLPVGVEPTGLPLVLSVHGGPWMHDHWGFDQITQFFANRGYAVLQVNFRGSSGYGRKHIAAGVRELGGKMHDDLVDACDWAVKEGYADAGRIGIFGGSYGGYSALVGVTVTPEYFAAAVDYVGISDLSNFILSLPAFVRPLLINSWLHYVGDPDDPDDLADMMARSPITMVDRIVTPLLVVQGANDVRVPKVEADNIVAALAERGVPVEYVVADDEGHGFVNPENNIRMYRAVEKHFAAHLGGRTA